MQELKEMKILQVVEKTKSDAKQHVDDSQDNGHLHLEGVQECQLVDWNTPYLKRHDQFWLSLHIEYPEKYSLSKPMAWKHAI